MNWNNNALVVYMVKIHFYIFGLTDKNNAEFEYIMV